MIFLRLYFGYLVQIIPFAILCFWPFKNNFRFSKKKSFTFTIGIILGCTLIFSSLGTYFSQILPGNHSLFQTVNLIFMICLLPCLFWYIYTIKAMWQKKLFIFSFTITYALAITSLINTLTTWIYYNVPTDGLPYKGYSILISFSISTLFLPLWILFYKKFFSSIEETLGANETGALSILSLLLFVALASGLSFIEYTSLFDNPMAFFLYFTLLSTILIIYFLYFKMYSSIHEKYIAENKYLKIEYDMQMLDKQYIQLHDNIEMSRRLKHDLKHHMLVLQEYLNRNETELAKKIYPTIYSHVAKI